MIGKNKISREDLEWAKMVMENHPELKEYFFDEKDIWFEHNGAKFGIERDQHKKNKKKKGK